MTLTTTFKLLKAEKACESGYKKLRKNLKGIEINEPINLLTILESNGFDDALWALRATEQNCDRIARLMAVDFAESVLHIWTAQYPNDNRPALAIQAARNFANGLITRQNLVAAARAARAAWDAAWDATRAAARDAARAAWVAAWDATRAAARDAWDAAGDAAWDAARDAARDAWDAAGDAAWDAEREKQITIFKSYLQPEEK